ncbi:MAG: 7,8-didemethyl-8-hydroxy-5-deazariboflavin synthase subunit CofH [Candidatus Dadabacteria bacterium]|nr:MAG: 7,8-didemethyl-8-hydroxy-5-deazariboflavin synthase subunit CofH [Candidatus Dadabacteria bacterium]
MTSLSSILDQASPAVRRLLDCVLSGHDLAVDDAVRLFEVTGPDLRALCGTADHLRREQAGDLVTYVVNRNINFTNVCVKACKFCAFSRDLRSEQGYLLPTDEIIRRTAQARDYGATEVCLQAGLAPTVDGSNYIELCRTVHEAIPDVHLHAFSPEEIRYGVQRSKLPLVEYLTALKDAGLGSLPGTSAEILDDTLRRRIAPGRISTQEWIDVITTAHGLGIPTTSTMMFGHVETFADRARHLDLLRSIQRDTGGFTEFVPLSFVHEEAPLFAKQEVAGVLPGPDGNDVLRTYAIARLMLGRDIPNLQASWVKEGLRMTQLLLDCGVNDVGGTLMNESISTKAGARNGQLMTPAVLRRLIRGAGREPAERSTTYTILRRFGMVEDPDVAASEPLNSVEDAEAVFGSYDELANDPTFHYDFDRDYDASRTLMPQGV